MNDSPLQAALARLSIPALGAILFPDWRYGKSCRCPWREDRSPSFSVYDDERKWKDFGTHEGGDAADFLSKALGLSHEDGCRKLIEMAGTLPRIPHFPREKKRETDAQDKVRQREGWPFFEKPSAQEVGAIAELRGLSIEGVQLAVDRGLLWCCQSQEGQAWVITDSRRVNAQARRMDGRPWKRIGGKKAWTLPGSEAAWPIGLREASSFRAIALVEGGPDLLGALHLGWCAGVESAVAPVAMLGAANRIPAEALSLFAGRRVRIFGHSDYPGQVAAARWAEQLAGAGCDVDGYSFEGLLQSAGEQVGDLCDFAHLDVDTWESCREEIEQAFTFAPQCPTICLPAEMASSVQAGACEALPGKEAA